MTSRAGAGIVDGLGQDHEGALTSLSQRWLQEARALAPGRVITDPVEMEPYGHDESSLGMVKPTEEKEVAAILHLRGHRFPDPLIGSAASFQTDRTY